MRNQPSMLELMLKALENTGDIMLRYQYQKDMMKKSFLDRQEREKLKEEIVQEVLARISIDLEDEAIKQLRDMLNDLV